MHQDLSPRERDVVALVAEGKTNREIALELRIKVPTVKDHMESAMRKYGVDNRVSLAMRWRDEEAK
jgi:DNA-binding CsgD family transcriptional regulator